MFLPDSTYSFKIIVLVLLTLLFLMLLIVAAAKQMRERILQLVLDSFRDQLYAKALDCVKVLRQEAIKVSKLSCILQLPLQVRSTN